MGHASHDPWAYGNDDGEEEPTMVCTYCGEVSTLRICEACDYAMECGVLIPDALPSVPPVIESDPFPEADDVPPPPPQPWDNGRMFGAKAYPSSERQVTRRGWRKF